MVWVILTATAHAEFLDYFIKPKKPSGLYTATSIEHVMLHTVSILDFRGDNTFNWEEHEVVVNVFVGGAPKIPKPSKFNVSGTWVIRSDFNRIELLGLREPHFFVLDDGDLIEQRFAKRRFLKKDKANPTE